MRKTMFISIIFFVFYLSLLIIPSAVDADFYVIPVGRQTRINAADVVQADTIFGNTYAVHKFDRRLPDGTYQTEWAVPAGKKLVITNLSVSPYDLTDDKKCYFQFGGYNTLSSLKFIQDFLVSSGQTYNFSFGVGSVVDSGNWIAIIPKTGATGVGVAFINGYLIDE